MFQRMRKHFVIAALLVVLPILLSSAPAPVQEAYIWQRSWTPAVVEASKTHASNFSRYVVLGAEVTWHEKEPSVARANPDYALMGGLGIPAGVALRIGPYPGPFHREDAQVRYLCERAREIIAQTSSKGLRIAELQLDFDCRESQLDGYAVWVAAIKAAISPVRLSITALPAWLKQPALPGLLRACDGYVLQVHSLERPVRFDAPFDLCRPDDAVRWVTQASSLGVPFRVALPTYGYAIAFNADGKFVGLSAEGRLPDWPAGTRVREVTAEPQRMAKLVSLWRTNPPPGFSGVIWYRLPVSGDVINWRWETLDAVMHGKSLQTELIAEAKTTEPGLVEIDLINRGSIAVMAPTWVTMRWRGSRLVAADSLAGFSILSEKKDSVCVAPQSPWKPLEPGARRRIAWARFSKPTEVSLETSDFAP